jgi:multiple antibiotic resistance protein
MMSQVALGVNFFVALFALIDPIGNIPLFAAATVGVAAPARLRIALYISVFAAVFLVFFYFTGVGLLQYFGISMPAFRIAGGIMLFLLGLEMARDDFTAKFADGEASAEVDALAVINPARYARKHFERLIVPFGMPLLIGPGAISAVVIYASESARGGWEGRGSGVVAILAIAATVFAAFALSGVISKALGKIGMTIVVRVLGLILCALAVQFVIVGLADATGGIIKGSAAHPYPDAAKAAARH